MRQINTLVDIHVFGLVSSCRACVWHGYLFYGIPYAEANEKKKSNLGLGGNVVINLLLLNFLKFRYVG